jgi:predicted anti-sigma-YlaC factor YlaD
MHRPIKERLEEYLREAGELRDPEEFSSHMQSCAHCRQEVEGMAEQARLLRILEAPEEIEPAPGFYARVMEALEARRRAPLWYAFVDPAFARRLIYASLATVVILGSYLVYSEQGPGLDASSPMSFMAVESADRQVGTDPQRDREVVLLSLASYQE